MISSRRAEELYDSASETIITPAVKQLDKIVEESGDHLEGNCFYHGNLYDVPWFYKYKRINFYNIVKDNNVKKMVEIGFNAGHSAIVFLAAFEKDASIYFFDYGSHPYARPCYKYLKDRFPQVKDFIEGDSRHTLPSWIGANSGVLGTFDCVHVDGGHSQDVCISDISCAHSLLRPGGILILDDTSDPLISCFIPSVLQLGYSFAYQIPTYGISHTCFIKN